MANFSVRVTTLVLSFSYLGPRWTLIFTVLVLILNSLYFHFSSTIPARFNALSSWLMSVTTTTLVVENISMKERGETLTGLTRRRKKSRIVFFNIPF